MAAPPAVSPAPRRAAVPPPRVVDLPGPPPMPVRGYAAPLAWVLLSALGLVIGIGPWRLMSLTALDTAASVVLLVALVLVAGGAVTALVVRSAQARAFDRALRQRTSRYHLLLDHYRDDLAELLLEQASRLVDNDPAPSTCLDLARTCARQLWQRTAADADFLLLRAGLGHVASIVSVRVAGVADAAVDDPLVEAARSVAERAAWVPNAPICVPLAAGATVLGGPRQAVVATARALLVQLATHHAPEAVRLAAVWLPDEDAEWRWLRWLPHVWSADGHQRCLAAEPAAARALLDRLVRMPNDSVGGGPIWVLLVADPALVAELPLAPARVRYLILAPATDSLAVECATRVDVGVDGRGTIGPPSGAPTPVVRVDRVSVDLADAVARALAPIRLASPAPPPPVGRDPLDSSTVAQVHLNGHREVLPRPQSGESSQQTSLRQKASPPKKTRHQL